MAYSYNSNILTFYLLSAHTSFMFQKNIKTFHFVFHNLFPPYTSLISCCGCSLRLFMFQICTKGKSALTRLKLHWIDQDMSKCQTRKMSSIKLTASCNALQFFTSIWPNTKKPVKYLKNVFEK